MKFLILGCSNEEIAQNLCLSPHTVKYHIAHIIKIIKAKNRVHAAAIIRDLEYEKCLDELYNIKVSALPLCQVRKKDAKGFLQPYVYYIKDFEIDK